MADETQSPENYKRIIDDIKNVLLRSAPKEVESDSDIERDKHLKDNISKRDDNVTLLLDNFVSEHNRRIEADKDLKKRFLKGLLIAICIIGAIIVASMILVFVRPLEVENLITLLGIIFTFIGSTLFIVKMLLNYLFPLDSDKNIIALISTIINHDLSQYQHLRNVAQQSNKSVEDSENSKEQKHR